MSLKCNICSLGELIELFKECEMVESLDSVIKLLNDVKSDLEEFLRVKEENKHLKEQLELYKWENEGLRHAYIEKIRGEISSGI